jgi:hypothetical protein
MSLISAILVLLLAFAGVLVLAKSIDIAVEEKKTYPVALGILSFVALEGLAYFIFGAG